MILYSSRLDSHLVVAELSGQAMNPGGIIHSRWALCYRYCSDISLLFRDCFILAFHHIPGQS
ncbi:hypothetical protein B565_1655 [Aeromonas veronii B565]|nr:hypothetical protein B565_1655 [Aeromonas veronii B565]